MRKDRTVTGEVVLRFEGGGEQVRISCERERYPC